MRDYLTGCEMRIILRNTLSSWRTVTIDVPQGSLLTPIIFKIYIDNIKKNLSSYIDLFTDDAKLFRVAARCW